MKEEPKDRLSKVHSLIKFKGSVYVPVSHSELDSLIGRLLQMADLSGDQEQRQALKQEIKWRCRGWLDDIYAVAGYTNHSGTSDSANIIEIED